MRNALLLFAFSIIFFVQETFAQTSENLSPSSLSRIGEVLPPSPNASSLGKFGGLPVNLSSGRSDINIPLHEIKTPNLGVSIGLSYSTSGYNVNEIASRVGLSWSLNFGGVITRTVLDGPDEVSQHLPPPNNFGPGDNQDILNYLDAVEQSTYDVSDCQHDIFTYNFGSYQGKFVINGNNVVFLQNDNLKIRTSLIETAYIDGCSFQIITPDGTTYYFGGADATEYSGSESFGLNCGGDKDFNMNQTAWYLKKVTHRGGDLITFFYSPVNFTYKASIHQSETRSVRTTDQVDPSCTGTTAPLTTSNSTCVTELISHGVRLDRITTSNSQNIDIVYQSREDLPGDYLVKNIIVYKYNSTSQIYKKFEFEYLQSVSIDYINSWNNEDALKKHIFLQSVTEKDAANVAAKGQHVFEYNSIAELPPRLSFSQDYWGFFNGKPNGSLVYFTPESQALNTTTRLYALFDAGGNRNSDAVFAQKGLLKKVIYPTGGFDEITYESHQHRVTETQIGNEQTLHVNMVEINDNDAVPKIGEATFTPNQNQTVPLLVACNYIGTDSYDPPADRVEFSVLNVTDNYYLYFERTLEAGNNNPNEFNTTLDLEKNKTYKIILKVYGQDVVAITLLSYKNYDISVVTINKNEGGVRVKQIHSNASGNVENIKRYIYAPIEDTTVSSCDLPYYFDNLTRTHTIIPCGLGCAVAEVENFTLSSSSYYNIALFGGSPISYRSVLESNGNNFENGGIEYKYSFEQDMAPERLYGVSPLSSSFTSLGFAHGILTYKRILQKKPTGWLTRSEEIYSYKIDNRVDVDLYDYSVRKNYFIKCYLPGTLKSVSKAGIAPFDVLRYSVRKRWIYSDIITTKQYAEDGSLSVTKVTVEEHLNPYHVKPSKTTISTSVADKSISKLLTFSQDVFMPVQPQWLTNLQNANYVETPIEELMIKKVGSINYVIGGQLFIYDHLTLKPSVIYSLKVSAPIPLTEFNRCSVSNGLFIFDSRYEMETSLSYNPTYANTESVKANNGIKAYLWDYSNSLPIAEASNAKIDQIAYTSFEGTGTGNWAFSGSTTDDATAPTGKKAALVGTGISKNGLVPSVVYRVSYWSKNGMYTVSGNQTANGFPKSGPLVNGWTYYEHLTTGSNGITISGSGLIDELRLLPVDAQMTTYTYEPLMGITSQCDANNRIMYYEYDTAGRLSVVYDQDRKVIRKMEYKYRLQ